MYFETATKFEKNLLLFWRLVRLVFSDQNNNLWNSSFGIGCWMLDPVSNYRNYFNPLCIIQGLPWQSVIYETNFWWFLKWVFDFQHVPKVLEFGLNRCNSLGNIQKAISYSKIGLEFHTLPWKTLYHCNYWK